MHLGLLRKGRLLRRALRVLLHVVLLGKWRWLRRSLPHVRWWVAVTCILLHTGEHTARSHTRSIHTLRHADARWPTVHLIWSERSVLLRHGRWYHVVRRHGLRAVRRSTHGLARPLWCLRWHAILAPWHGHSCRRHARRLNSLRNLGSMLPLGGSRTGWLHWRLMGPCPDVVQVLFSVLTLLF